MHKLYRFAYPSTPDDIRVGIETPLLGTTFLLDMTLQTTTTPLQVGSSTRQFIHLFLEDMPFDPDVYLTRIHMQVSVEP